MHAGAHVILAEIAARAGHATTDPALKAAAAGLALHVRLVCDGRAIDLRLAGEGASVDAAPPEPPAVTIEAPAALWRAILAAPPPPRHQSFTALQLVNPAVTVTGDPLAIAQARAALERLFECLRGEAAPPPAPAAERDLSQIHGRYAQLETGGEPHDVYYEEAGAGPALLMLHTAGADSRQYQALLADVAIAREWRLLAFDLPCHGRSFPPSSWTGGEYRLDQATYAGWVAAFIEQVVGGPVVLLGCSMGAAMALVLAAERPDLVQGVVALEPPLRSLGRRNAFLHHAAVNAGLHNPAYVRGLMSPTSPEEWRRRAAWIYAQGGPGIYSGDLVFYSEEFDGAAIAPRIDGRRIPVRLLTGEYDYSAAPEDGEALARLIPGSVFRRMAGLGHFPMCEHPDLFRTHLLPVLGDIAAHLPRS